MDNNIAANQNFKLSNEEMARTNRVAEGINKKNQAEGKKYGETLGKDSFLKLLVTELRHQDPTKPMEDRDFIGQMAQFSSLEQMSNVNKEMQMLNMKAQYSEAYSLIGKRVQAIDAETGKPVDGNVSHVVRKDDGVRLVVSGHEIALNDIHAVFAAKENENMRNIQLNQSGINNDNINTNGTPSQGARAYEAQSIIQN